MKIGVICEGHTDRAVIRNILKGLKDIDSSQIIALRPDYSVDETDLSQLPADNFSNWPTVKEECENQVKIKQFLSLEGQDFIIIHIDADKSHEYGVPKPVKDKNYADKMRAVIVSKINEWLGNNYKEEILYAVAIEETEAWILTIYNKKNSIQSADPKLKLKYILDRKGISCTQTHADFFEISSSFSKKKNFIKEGFMKYNRSLEAFCKEVEEKL